MVHYQQEDFTFCGSIDHIHPPTGSSLERAIVNRDVKEAAIDRPFDGIIGLIKNVLQKVPMPGPDIPNVENLRRAACHARAADRPAPPPKGDPHFSINLTYLNDKFPGFFQAEVWGKEGGVDVRHILLATSTQVKFLSGCKRVYMDRTYKLVEQPFRQLFS